MLFLLLAWIIKLFGLLLVLETVILRDQGNVTHWLTNLLLFGHLSLRMSLLPNHLASVLWRIIIAHFGRLSQWPSLKLLVLSLICVILSRILDRLLSAMSHRHVMWRYFLFKACVLTSVCSSLTDGVDFAHGDHWAFDRRLLLRLLCLCRAVLTWGHFLVLLINIYPVMIILLIWIRSVFGTVPITFLREAHLLGALCLILAFASWWHCHGLTLHISHTHLVLVERAHSLSINWHNFPCREKHRVDVIQMHLLQLGILKFLLQILIGCFIFHLHLVLHRLVIEFLLCDLCRRINTHELGKWAHWSNYAFASVNLVIHLHLHHFIPILSPMWSWSYPTNVFSHHLIQLFPLLLVLIISIYYLFIGICNITTGWWVESTDVALISTLVLGAVAASYPLLGGVIVRSAVMSGARFGFGLMCWIVL